MFTGIIQAIGQVAATEMRNGDLRLSVDAAQLAEHVEARRFAIGESIAVAGVCLTVIDWDGRCFAADVSQETLRLTTLGTLAAGGEVNLEAALRAGDPLGGHLLSGHVDGLARVASLANEARSLQLWVEAPELLLRYIAVKGSVALDGVSLTVNAIRDNTFMVNLIPHTVAVTTFRTVAAGQAMNLEVDQLARYVERGLLHLRP
jgi:riboflavin synthase